MPDEPMQETARTVEWDDLTPEQQAEVERKRAGRETTVDRRDDPERLSVWCSYQRHEVCRKTPCPCRCHEAPPARETTP